jgi:hypothetical protein
MKNKKVARLALNKDSIRSLESGNLARAQGAGTAKCTHGNLTNCANCTLGCLPTRFGTCTC